MLHHQARRPLLNTCSYFHLQYSLKTKFLRHDVQLLAALTRPGDAARPALLVRHLAALAQIKHAGIDVSELVKACCFASQGDAVVCDAQTVLDQWNKFGMRQCVWGGSEVFDG